MTEKNDATPPDCRLPAAHASHAWRLYFLAWLDALEKLDILVLELRHMQHTCIYTLREPALQQVLRTEEVLLDPEAGEEAQAFFKELLGSAENTDRLVLARELAARYVSEFPSFRFEHDDYPEARPCRDSPEDITDRLQHIWRRGLWSDASKDLYRVLEAAQQVKRQIFADRLLLYLDGFHILGLGGDRRTRLLQQAALPELFLTRMAILSRSHDYLKRIGDLQQRLAQHLESTPAQYPRPSVHRRRMQGVYTQYLAQRVQYLRRSMNMLLAALRGSRQPQRVPTTLHRWEHSHTSFQDVFLDEVGEHLARNKRRSHPSPGEQPRVEFVQTGFWMLDKPDNQPSLAHEVAHHAILQHYDNMLPHVLADASDRDAFAQLVMELTRVLARFRVPVQTEPWEPLQALISPLELACDLLAGAVKGISYLYAFYLEALGWGLEHTMVDEHGYVPHLSVRLELRQDFNAPRVRDLRDWYVRGRILVHWLRAIGCLHSTMDREVCTALECVLNQIGELLDRASIHQQDKSHVFWKNLTDRLCVSVCAASAAKRVKAWRQERREDQYAPRRQTHRFPRESQRLNYRLRQFLVEVLAAHKRALYRDQETVQGKDDKPDYYEKLQQTWRTPESQEHERELIERGDGLFLHIFDIPWQCAWIRAGDFYCIGAQPHPTTEGLSGAAKRGGDLYAELNLNTSMGRRMFFVALELDGFTAQSPCQRLRALLRELEGRDFPKDSDLGWLPGWTERAMRALLDENQLADRGSVEEIRRAQFQQGICVEEFVRRVDRLAKKTPTGAVDAWTRIFGNHARGSQIRYNLSLHRARTYDESLMLYERLVSYFKVTDATAAAKRGGPAPDISMVLASRASIAGKLKRRTDEDDNPLLGFYLRAEMGKPASYSERPPELFARTSGFYNGLFAKPSIKPLCRCVLPVMHEVHETSAAIRRPRRTALLLPIFMRRETWIELAPFHAAGSDAGKGKTEATGSRPSFPDPAPLQGVIGVLYVQLLRRFARLDFVDWLFQGGCTELGLGPLDRIYLTDGWADLVLLLKAFRPNGMRRSRSDFFQVRNALSNHLLVRRLETMATDDWSRLAPQQGFPIFVSIRLDDLTPHRPSIDKVVDALREHAATRSNRPRIIAIPGATDLTLVFDHAHADMHQCLQFLEDAGVASAVDRVMVQVGADLGTSASGAHPSA